MASKNVDAVGQHSFQVCVLAALSKTLLEIGAASD